MTFTRQPALAGTDKQRFESILQLESELEDWLGPDVDVDGNDFGSGEMNIFIHTDTPEETFGRIQMLIDTMREFSSEYRAGYRKFTEGTFQVIWPPGATYFTVI